LRALPSFLYFPTEAEVMSGSLALPWNDKPEVVVGSMAKEHGTLVTGRLVSAAKSWLCQHALDPSSAILPRDAEPPEPSISPVDASASYLTHLKMAWNYAMADSDDTSARLENQDIVLTVPASFDEEARELTVEAARRAGLTNITLLEEPLAAFYSWIARDHAREQLNDGDLVLVCDIGGGTSDFSLMRSRIEAGALQFERVAIGEHLLLGGENLDLALALQIQGKLNARLTLRQRSTLQVACSAAKERILADDNTESAPVSILGSGKSVVGQMLSAELTRKEVIDLLKSFLPVTAPEEPLEGQRKMGLREVGLPYQADPAITKHLAAFLRKAALTPGVNTVSAGPRSNTRISRPDAVLFNGGFCIPEIARQRLLAAIAHWFEEPDWRPVTLSNDALGEAVALGAAYYGAVRRGHGLRVKAGSARSYYVGLRSEQGAKAVCVLPSGTDEGTTMTLMSRDFTVLTNRPVTFQLYSSTTRWDAHEGIADVQPEQMHVHAPLGALLRHGKKFQENELAVRLSVTFTEVGTLELWCESASSPHRWRLQFQVRGDADQADEIGAARRRPAAHDTKTHATGDVAAAAQLIMERFSKQADGQLPDVKPLVKDLESALGGVKREAWPLGPARTLADALLKCSDGRKLSPTHEARWLNLLGYCLRPGFGDLEDNNRLRQLRRIYEAGLGFPRELQGQIDWLVLWRRVAGGLSPVNQNELRGYLSTIGVSHKKVGARINPQVDREAWRLAASLEHTSSSLRAALGGELLRRLKKTPLDSAWLWALGRLGSRIPLYGPLNCVVPPEVASQWIAGLLQLRELNLEVASAIAQIARYTGDRTRDVPEDLREQIISALSHASLAEPGIVQRLRTAALPDRKELAAVFGETLPRGIHFESNLYCLSPVAALKAKES
jgi:hypothetical protein